MDNFCKLPAEERKVYFEVAANSIGLSIDIVEKDFWVCWTLRRLFALQGISNHLIFKGGTSLSKVFGVIERFSEDIDLSIHREHLGFTGDDDPENVKGSNQQKRKIEELGEACQIFVKNTLLPALKAEIERALGTNEGWTLELDVSDPEQPSLIFPYPSTKIAAASYIPQKVKIEIGARSDHWPAGDHAIIPYLSQHVPAATTDPQTTVRVMEVERTFWEKATILHEYANYPEGKKPKPRQSRHYYDFYRLLNSEFRETALKRLDLLERVAEHKQIYHRSARAKYEEAKRGTLKLTPAAHLETEMKRDYGLMDEMIFFESPSWDDMMNGIRRFETEFNAPASAAAAANPADRET